jgi:hypothetical protein
MCAVILPPGVNPIAVKYIYHKWRQAGMNYGFWQLIEMERIHRQRTLITGTTDIIIIVIIIIII